MQHEQDCCARALQAAEQHRQAAAARAKAIANEATAWHRQAEETRRQAALAKAKRHKVTLATEEHHRAAILAAKQEASKFAMLMASLQELVEERRHHKTQAAKALALVEEHCHHEAVLAAEADKRRRYEATAQAVEPEALTPDEDCRHHESVMRASISTVITLADKQRRHEAADRPIASDDMVIERIRTEFALCASPLDAILVEIACEECRHHEAVLAAETNGRRYEAATRTVESEDLTLVRRHEAETWASLSTVSPLADEQSCHEAAARATASAQLALAVCPRARPRRRTGRRNIPCAPSCFVKVAPTHPELLQGGLPTPTSTMLVHAISPCRSVVSSPTPVSTTPHTPSLHPFTFNDGTLHTSGGGNTHPFRARGLPLPPWKRTRCKYRPHRTCRHHQPRAPNQSTGWA
jgi:hypothetical protein